MLLNGLNGLSLLTAQEHVALDHKAEFVIVLDRNAVQVMKFKHKYAILMHAQENVLINVLTVSHTPPQLIVGSVGIIWVYIVAKHVWNNREIQTTKNKHLEDGVHGHHTVTVVYHATEVYKRELEFATVQAHETEDWLV